MRSLLSFQLSACPKYNRKDYRHWIDEDRDCQNTRNEVLIQESLDPVTYKSSKGCKVSSGKWHGSFTGEAFTNPRQLDIDHLVPPKEAHESGAHSWSKSRKRDYANDMSHPDHLIAVASGANRSKGAKDPAEWMHQIRLTGGSMLKHGRESRSDGTLPPTEMKLQCFVNFLESTPNFQIKH